MDWTQALTIIGIVIGGFLYMMARMDSNQKSTNDKFETMGTRFNGLENRLTSMESEIKNTNQRIDNTNQRITDLGQKVDQRITDLKTDMNQRLSTIEGYLVPKKVFHFEEPHKDGSEEPKEN